MRRVTRRARAAGLTIAIGLVLSLFLSGCATTPTYHYIGNSDRDLILRVPHNWTAIKTNDALKASGVDPATETGWTAFYDANSHPDAKHFALSSTDEPILFATTINVTADERSGVTDDALRELMLQGQTADTAAGFSLLENRTEKTSKQEGVHVIFTYSTGTSLEISDRIALTNRKKTIVGVVYVHCSQQCFTEHKTEIDDAVTSLTLKTN